MGGLGVGFEFRFFGGGYLGTGIGGLGGDEDDFLSFGGGFDGKEENRLTPGRDARIFIELQ